MHPEAYSFVKEVAQRLGPRQSVLEIGSRDVNGTVRPLFNGSRYLGIDQAPGYAVDEVANGATYTPAFPVDTVVCCEVLEHTNLAETIVQHALEILDPEGALIITCAAPPRAPHSAVDGCELRAGEYYQNVEPVTLRDWVITHGGEVVVLGHSPVRGDVYVWARRANEKSVPLWART